MEAYLHGVSTREVDDLVRGEEPTLRAAATGRPLLGSRPCS